MDFSHKLICFFFSNMPILSVVYLGYLKTYSNSIRIFTITIHTHCISNEHLEQKLVSLLFKNAMLKCIKFYLKLLI